MIHESFLPCGETKPNASYTYDRQKSKKGLVSEGMQVITGCSYIKQRADHIHYTLMTVYVSVFSVSLENQIINML